MDQSLHHLHFAQNRLGYNLPNGARILDFGCGNGISTKALAELNYDVRGVDIADHWNTFNSVPPDIRARLLVIPRDPKPLPFPSRYFDFCFSDQVFEHLFDYEWAFTEIARVLKPGALSCHRFPGPNRLTEGHIQLPIPLLCYSRLYLSVFALAGRRRSDQEHFSWRQTVDHNEELMRANNYPSKRRLYAIARGCDVNIEFRDAEEFSFRRRDVPRVVQAVIRPLLNRYMIIRAAESLAT